MNRDPDALLAALFGHGATQPQLTQAEDSEYPYDEEQEEYAEEQDHLGAGLDFDVDEAEVISRIESFVFHFIQALAQGELPDYEVLSRSAAGRTLEAGEGEEHSLQAQRATVRRSLWDSRGPPEGPEQYARIFRVASEVHALLLAGAHLTQRELYYRLKPEELFRSMRDVTNAVQDVVSLLHVSRPCLNITCSSKGLVGGRLVVDNRRTGVETDCSLQPNGVEVTGDIAAIRRLAFQSAALLILVVEKDTVFQRLLDDRFFDRVPSILITAKGMPDMATRAFVHALHAAFPHLPVLGVVDWNPSGVAILSVYRWGSLRMGLESPRYAVPSLQWLAVRQHQLQEVGADAFQVLTDRDRAMAANQQALLREAEPDWAAEVGVMAASGHKAEVEAVQQGAGASLADLLALELADGGYIPEGW